MANSVDSRVASGRWDRTRLKPRSRMQVQVAALEPRLLLSGSANLVTNPDFFGYKPGSTTVTATLPSGGYTNGLGSNLLVLGPSGTVPTATYSDGTSGRKIDVPGWIASSGKGGVGVDTGPFPTASPASYAAYISNVDGRTTQSEQITQNLAVSLQPNTTYTLSCLVGGPNNDEPLVPITLALQANGQSVALTTTSDAPLNVGQYSTFSNTYSFGNAAPSGPVSVLLGAGPEANATAVMLTNFTDVSLTAVRNASPSVTLNKANLTPKVTSIVIDGTGFDPTPANDSVLFNDGAIGSVIAASPTSLTVTFSTEPTSGVALTAVVTSDGVSSGAAVQVATVIDPVVTANAANLPVNPTSSVIRGSGFDPAIGNDSISFNDGAAGKITAATSNSLTVTFSTAPVNAGSLTAVVTSDGVSSGIPVQVATAAAAPVPPTVTPNTANLPIAATSIVIDGSGFDPTAARNSVVFNDGAVASVTAASPSSLTATFSTKPTAPGTLTAAVTTDGLASGASVQVATVILTPVSPTVSASTANLRATATSIIIHGTGFSATIAKNSVVFSGAAAGSVTSASPTSLTVTFSARPAAAGTLTAVVTSNGLSSGSPVQVATVTVAPTVTASSARLAANANSIVIDGTGFDANTANDIVTFSDGAVGSVTTASPTSLTVTFTTAPVSAGTLTAVVSSDSLGSGAAVPVATVISTPVTAPTVTISTAILIATTPGITINGTGFDPTPANDSITFSDSAVGIVTASSPTSLNVTFSTAPVSAGPLTVVVTSDGVSSGAPVQVATVSPVMTPSPTPHSTTPGSPDATFNGGNNVVLGFAADASAVTSGGQIVLAGLVSGASAGTTQAVLERLNGDGSIDSNFGANGTVTDPVTSAFYGVVTESDGTIVAAGTSNGDLLLAGFDSDGSVDTSFGAGGTVLLPIAGAANAIAYGVATDANGDLVVVGSAAGQFLADRFTAAGEQEPGFNNGAPLLFGNASDGDVLGKVAVENPANGSGIIATGASNGGVVVVQLTPAGALDASFGSGGIAKISALAAPDLLPGQPNSTEGLALDPAGNIVVANTSPSGQFATARLTPAGALDNTFGSGGVVTTSFGGNDDADFVAIQPDGSQIILGGTSTNTTTGTVQEAIAAYTPIGALDTTFATGGMELLSTGLSAVPALARPTGPFAPQADGLAGLYVEEVLGNLQGGKLLVGAGQEGRATPSPGSVLRLIAPAPTAVSLPTGTLGATVSASLPVGAVVGGARTKASALVTVSNPVGNTAFSGPVTVTLLVSLGQSLGGATQLLAVTEKLKLKAGAHKTLRIKLSSFPSLPKASYYLIATVKAPDNSITGASVATPSLTIAPAFARIATSNLRGTPATIAPGKKLSLSLTLQNNGNEPAAGTAPLTVSLSAGPTGAGGTTIATVPLRVKLKAGKAAVYRVKFAVPAGTTAGSYYLAASLAVTSLGDTIAADGVAVSAAPVIVS